MKKKPKNTSRKKAAQSPKVYSKNETDALETHILKFFGKYENVLHEVTSTDIHVDIFVIEPSAERNYYTLVTMGMGARRMNVPQELRERRLERAEMMICLPPDWEVNNSDEKFYWAVRWLKIMARLPIANKTWLGWGHTVPNGEPFAENTGLCCMLVTLPTQFGEKSAVCQMPDGSQVIFYQLVPLYEDEMNFKLQNDAGALLDKMTDEMLAVVDINRPSVLS
jgi:hypothetical protein